MDGGSDRERERESESQIGKKDRDRERERERQRDRQTAREGQRVGERERETDRQTERDRDRERERQTEREREESKEGGRIIFLFIITIINIILIIFISSGCVLCLRAEQRSRASHLGQHLSLTLSLASGIGWWQASTSCIPSRQKLADTSSQKPKTYLPMHFDLCSDRHARVLYSFTHVGAWTTVVNFAC